MSLSPAHLGGSSMVLSRWSGPRPLLPRGDIRSSDPWPLPCCEVASLGVQISLETWPAFLGVCPATSWLTGPFAGMSFLLLVALHYFWSFLSWTSFPATLPAPRGGGGAPTHLCAGKQLCLGCLPPLWGCPGPSPLTGGGPRRVLGSEDPWGGPRGLLPFPSLRGSGLFAPPPDRVWLPGPPPPSCLLPDAWLGYRATLV